HAVERTHITIREFHHVEFEYLLQRGDSHVRWNHVAKACEVRVPLAGKLIRHDAVTVRAVRIVIEIAAVPKLLDVSGARLLKKCVILRGGGRLAYGPRNFLCGAEGSEVEPARICARAARDPRIVSLVRIAFILN